MSSFKWADVAHMYLKSEILIQTNDAGIREMLGAQGTRGVMYATRAHAMLSRWSQHKPILRHRDDMTGEERNTHFTRLAQFYADGVEVPIGWETFSLISMGVDAFGLIEAGEAIRKEPGNG